jgi:two-component system sensor histidine kinase QseC
VSGLTQAPRATYSLRRRLLLLLTLVSGLLWLGMAISSYLRAHHEADEIFDAQLAEVAQALLVIADTATPGQLLAMPLPTHRYQQKILFQIWATRNGKQEMLVRSENSPQEPIAHDLGFSEREWNGETWRFYSQEDNDDDRVTSHHRVYVAQSHTVRDELAGDIVVRLMAPLLLGLPLLAMAIWFAVGAAMRPLSSMANQVRGRHPDRLDPLETKQVMPEEVAPLVAAINDLFSRVEATIASERNFTADAAHELRTPLAALKVQAQVAQRADDVAVRQQALAQVVVGVARMTHLVEQLLTLARLDPLSLAQSCPQRETVDLAALAVEAAALAMPQALSKQLELEVVCGSGEMAPRAIQGNPGLLQVLLRNLLENAIRYTPDGGRIEVSVEGTSLWVRDSGPGIPAEYRARVLDRFYRHNSEALISEGAGLGLSIVARIVQLHGASLSLEEGDAVRGLGGLAVQVNFGKED